MIKKDKAYYNKNGDSMLVRSNVNDKIEKNGLNHESYMKLSFLEKYFVVINMLDFQSRFKCPTLDDIIIEDFESLMAIVFLSQGSKNLYLSENALRRYGIDFLEKNWNLDYMRWLYKMDGGDNTWLDESRDSFVDKFVKKILSLSKEQQEHLVQKASLLISENFSKLLEKIPELGNKSVDFVEEIFCNKYIDIKLKRKLYDFMIKNGKLLSFDYHSAVYATPELLAFPNIFTFLNKFSVISALSELSNFGYNSKEEWLIKTEVKRKRIFELLREAYSNTDDQGKYEIRTKLYSAMDESRSWFFEELEKEKVIGEELNQIEKIDIEEELGRQLIINKKFNSVVIARLLISYVEHLKEKYGLELEIRATSNGGYDNTLGFYMPHSRILFINFSLIEYTKAGILKAISTINHEVVHALQEQKEHKEKADYDTLIQIIDNQLERNCYELNYAHISFENDANARAYVETVRFVTQNCPELIGIVQENLVGDLNNLRERIRLTHNEGLSFDAMPAIFMFLAAEPEKQITLLNELPLLKKVFYYDSKEQKVKMYGKTHFRNLLVIAKFRKNKKDIEFYENILLDFRLKKYLQKSPTENYDNPEYLEALDKKVRGRR